MNIILRSGRRTYSVGTTSQVFGNENQGDIFTECIGTPHQSIPRPLDLLIEIVIPEENKVYVVLA